MTSESPGLSERKMKHSKYIKKQTCDKFQCLQDENLPAIRVKLFQKDVKSDRKRTSKKYNQVLYSTFQALYFFLLVLKIPPILRVMSVRPPLM